MTADFLNIYLILTLSRSVNSSNLKPMRTPKPKCVAF